MQQPEQPENNRRKFLVGATLGSAGAVAAAVVGGTATDVLDTTKVAAAKKVKGYHETDHIRQYYETTRI
ncbi:MAG: hypothetical protein JNN20_10495 [Betaproteobacteria bacterium]|nr:hypothetical protein [Betaproteobacteria bacterium]